ncbi:hypothetical protein [Clostridium sp. AN503]|uniref:hypothetical protein n=1 Tax=Clostridium sp. AN503 TaxID=3160598 RepID=UPI0034586F1B
MLKYTQIDFIMEVSDTYMQGSTQRVTGNCEERSFGRRLMPFSDRTGLEKTGQKRSKSRYGKIMIRGYEK